ncbi:MAG TPA: DUF4184 family protein [Lacipirellulaceae bacterium]|jgi:small-conductance mechanosensitive channel|nr:DUF4184 family protein [Lacipirellulaceae bacterium]
MPYTLSHPLAVVPFQRWCPAYLNFPALVIGSMAPDFGYFVGQFNVAGFAHTIPGSFVICVPIGLLVLGLFYALRRPVCFLLPQPHRAALMPLAVNHLHFSVREMIVACASLLFGAWTHIAWDSCTHIYGWPAQHWEFMSRALIQIGSKGIPTYQALQLGSTVVGAAGLVVLYVLWLWRHRRTEPADDQSSDGWRYLLLASIAAAALAIALAAAIFVTNRFEFDHGLHTYVFWIAVYSITAFFPMIAVAAIVVDRMRPAHDELIEP